MTSGTELLNAKDFNSKAAIGFQLGAIRHGPCGWDLELGYFQIDGWKASTDQTGDLFMATSVSGDTLIGVNVTDAQAEYKSALHLAEINLRRQWCDGFTVLGGFRAGELNEIYSASGNERERGQPGQLEHKTFNHLYGFQIGADWEFYNMGGPLRISACARRASTATSPVATVHSGRGHSAARRLSKPSEIRRRSWARPARWPAMT